MTIRKRLTIWYASLLTFIIVLLGAVVFLTMRWMLVNEIDNSLDETAVFINNNSSLVPLPFNQQLPFGLNLPPLDVFGASGVEVQVWLMVNDEFRFIASSANLANYQIPLDSRTLGTTENSFRNVVIDNTQWRVRTSPIWSQNGEFIGSIQVASSLQTVNSATNELFIIIIVSCGFAILGAAGLGFYVAGHVLKPIEDITHAAAYIAGTKDLTTRLQWNGPMDELGRLNSVFNQMMSRLEHLFSVQQQFVADISHELRTPITSIRGNVEMMQRYGADDESLEAIHSESERMSRLVNDLLLLARADYGGLKIDLYPVDLDTVLQETFEQAKTLLQDHDIEFKLEHLEPIRVSGNSDRIKQMLLNLIDNSIKFTPDGGRITISLERSNHTAVIRIQDTGIGIKSEEISRIFDRFYQSDPARTHRGGGFGLGLSIVKWIIDSHGGSIDVDSAPGQGTTFSVMLPIYGYTLQNDDYSQVNPARIAISHRSNDRIGMYHE